MDTWVKVDGMVMEEVVVTVTSEVMEIYGASIIHVVAQLKV